MNNGLVGDQKEGVFGFEWSESSRRSNRCFGWCQRLFTRRGIRYRRLLLVSDFPWPTSFSEDFYIECYLSLIDQHKDTNFFQPRRSFGLGFWVNTTDLVFLPLQTTWIASPLWLIRYFLQKMTGNANLLPQTYDGCMTTLKKGFLDTNELASCKAVARSSCHNVVFLLHTSICCGCLAFLLAGIAPVFSSWACRMIDQLKDKNITNIQMIFLDKFFPTTAKSRPRIWGESNRPSLAMTDNTNCITTMIQKMFLAEFDWYRLHQERQ